MKLVERIGVIGNGVVGGAVARSWLEYAGEVRVYDKEPARSMCDLKNALRCDFVFICLPTPVAEDGTCDISAIREVLQVASKHWGTLVIRSTVPPGTTRQLSKEYDVRILHSPEFLTARCNEMGARLPSRNLIGEIKPHTEAVNKLVTIYQQRWPGVPTLIMEAEESELVKLICNSFFGTKISFFNEMKQISDALKCRWPNVIKGVLSDGRIAREHTDVPGPDGELGFGGACLPKDLAMLMEITRELKITPHVLIGAMNKNLEVRNGG